MPGCGEEVPEMLRKELGLEGGSTSGPHEDIPAEDTNKTFVRDMTYEELEELIETCVRRVLQGDDIKREYERLKATIKNREK